MITNFFDSSLSNYWVKIKDTKQLLRKTHEAHLGIHHGAIESLTAGHSYLDDFGRKLSQINI